MKITIDNEEVLSNKDFTINEEMLNTSSVILNNVYPVEWEQDKDYVSRFYYPEDYSKCKIFNETYHPEEKSTASGTSFTLNNVDTDKGATYTAKGQTSQSGTPTPSSPIPINITTGRQVVSVCEKNLFDKNNLQEINGYFSASQTTIASNAVNYTFYISCQPNTTYTITITSGTGTFNFGYTETLPAINTQVYGITTTKTLTTGANGHYLVCRYYHSNNASKTKQQILDSIQIEKGNQATTYEEYKGNDYEINLGKNLLDIPDKTATNNGITLTTTNGITTLNNTATANSFLNFYNSTSPMQLEAGTYTLSANNPVSAGGSSGQNVIRLSKPDGNLVSGSTCTMNTINATITFTITEPTICYLQARTQSGTSYTDFIIKPQLEKGSVASSYTPYKTPIYLGKIGTYQDYIFRNTTENPLYDSNLEEGQWYIHKEIGRVVLNGSETTINTATNNRFRVYLTTDYAKASSNTINVMSDKLIGVSQATTASTTQDFVISANNDSFFIRNTTTSSVANFRTWLSTNTPIVYYILNTPTNTLIEDEELINQLESIKLISGLNNVSISSPNLPFIMDLVYNYVPAYTEEDMLFCGIVKNTGNISLNPRYPHYCNLQVLDFKDFLSQGETLDFVINNKTIEEAIEQVISVIAPYGFIKGEVKLNAKKMVMGAYSTKDKTAYDVFNYIADITQSRWTTRMIDENTIAVDFYDTDQLPVGTPIEYNQTWFANHKIDDMSFSYSSNDYRNKQVMLSGEVYANIETTEVITADGYQTQFNTIDKIGYVSSIAINGTPATIITKDEYELGYVGDFIYQPGNAYFESDELISTGAVITIVYYAIIEGREIVLNQNEIQRVSNMTGRKGIVARYENRNDATTTDELQRIGKSYLKYKGIPEIKLNVSSRENTWNIGDRVIFNSPLAELSQEYMVKSKKIQHITTIDELFYEYELTSSFNMEQEVNFFDNQRYKTNGNIGEGEYISRNIDIENTANIIFYDLEVNEVQISGDSTLQSTLQAPLGVE